MLKAPPPAISSMRGTLVGLVLGLFLVLAVPVAYAQNTQEGDVYSVSISPTDPVVFDPVTISVGVKNPSGKPIQYSMDVIVTKDGEIQQDNPFTFTLGPGEGTFLSPTFKSKDIGEYQVVVKLSDVFGDVKDIEIRKFTVVSEIGPFDIAVDTPSKIIVPGTITPVILTLANMGEKATDIQVRVTMTCNNEPNIAQDFFVFLFPGAVQDKELSGFRTCNEVGAHDLTASIIVFNKTWITAVNQVFLNQSTVNLDFTLPDNVAVRAGESKVFDLQVVNNGNAPVDNLRILIPKIPSDWLQISPSSIQKVSPGQSVLFIVNITPPRDAPESDILMGVSIASDQVLNRKETDFKVVPLEGVLPGEAGNVTQISLPGLNIGFLGNNALYIGIGAIAAVGGIVGALRFRRKPAYHEKMERHADGVHSGENLRKVAETLAKRKH